MQRRYWNQQEDQALKKIVLTMTQVNWTMVSVRLNMSVDGADRNAKQCRERWLNKLVKQSSEELPWTSDEDKIILQQFLTHHKVQKNKWILISQKINKSLGVQEGKPERTPNQIKNRFYSIVRKGVRRINNKLGKPIPAQEVRLIKPIITSKLLDKMNQDECREFIEIIYNISNDFPQLNSYTCQINTNSLQKILTNIINLSRSQKKPYKDYQDQHTQKPKTLKKRKSSLSTNQEQLLNISTSFNTKIQIKNIQHDYLDLFINSFVQESVNLEFEEIDFGI